MKLRTTTTVDHLAIRAARENPALAGALLIVAIDLVLQRLVPDGGSDPAGLANFWEIAGATRL